MFGIRFIKAQPTTYILHYANGRVRRQGAGLSFLYFAPSASLAAVPIASLDAPFIFRETTADFQEVSVQGQLTYRIVDAAKIARVLNYTLDEAGRKYVSDDPEKLAARMINLTQVLVRKEIELRPMREAIRAADQIVAQVRIALDSHPEVAALGIEILGFTLLAIKPAPESARALETATREQLLREADDAIYLRRNAAIEQERAVKENELNTEIAIRLKQRAIRDAELESERIELEARNALNAEELGAKIRLEDQNKEFVALSVENQKADADAKAYAVAAAMRALAEADPRVVQALAAINMRADQLVATAFTRIAERADQIGQLNISPDLMRELMHKKGS